MPALDQINQGGTIYEIVPEIAELFKTTKAYHTGDHVIYEAGWYTFKADKSAGAWDATKVNGPFKVTDQLSDLKEDINALKDVTTISETETQTVTDVITTTWTNGYIDVDGSVYSGTTYQYSTKIDVQAGDVIQPKRESDSANINTIRFLTAYNNNVVNSSLGGTNVSTPYTVPSGIDQIVISINVTYGNATVNRTRTSTVETLIPKLKPDVDTLYNVVANAKRNSMEYSFNLPTNGSFTSETLFEDMCAYRIFFNAKIGTFDGETKIGKGIGQPYGAGIGFDGTNLYEYVATTASPARTQAHGLTLKDYVSIIIDVPYSKTITVTISTNGGSYKWTVPFWRSYYGSLSVSTVSALTNCTLSYTCASLITDTWVYGDSYLAFQSNDRWPYYLVDTGHNNYLLNGFPGRNSVQALASLKVDLNMNRTPKRILWLLGMNDKDGADTPNANWKTSVEEVMEICEQNHIELILATIPNVPASNTKNTLKNTYVVNSGYRYIDFANAISADGSSTWYDGMLSADNVHPDEQGAIALYNCAVTDVPELIL